MDRVDGMRRPELISLRFANAVGTEAVSKGNSAVVAHNSTRSIPRERCGGDRCAALGQRYNTRQRVRRNGGLARQIRTPAHRLRLHS